MQNPLNPGKETFGLPYHANTGVPDWIFLIFLILVIYMIIYIILNFRRKSPTNLTKGERELSSIKELISYKIKTKPKNKISRK